MSPYSILTKLDFALSIFFLNLSITLAIQKPKHFISRSLGFYTFDHYVLSTWVDSVRNI